jgi:two-component system, sensor histidine kinase and response regulator
MDARTGLENRDISLFPSLDVENPMDEEPVDWEQALEAVEGRRELLRELVEIFFAECPTLMASIRQAIDGQDAGELKLYAHRLKGCLRYFGVNRAGEYALELENMGRAGELKEAAAKYVELESALNRLIPALKKAP